jgi:hypothetical protein
MGGQRSRAIAVGLWLATLATVVATVVLIVLGRTARVPDSWGFRGFPILFAIAFGTVGALIRIRVPTNLVGSLFLFVGLMSGLQVLTAEYVIYGVLVSPGSLPWVREMSWVQTWDWVPFAGASTTFLLLLFPDGHLLSERWRPVAWLALGGIVSTSIVLAFTPGPIDNAQFLDNPLGVEALSGQPIAIIGSIAIGTLVLGILLSAASLVIRFRRSRGTVRQQLKWFALASTFAGLMLAGPGTLLNLLFYGSALQGRLKEAQVLTILGILLIPISAGIAILRYHLYDIDRIVSRTISYASITAVLAAVYSIVTLLLQDPLRAVTGGNALAVAASTLVVAALFQPLRARLHAAVDRRFNRARYDANATAAIFAARLRDEVDLPTLTAELDRVVRSSVAPSQMQVWLRTTGRGDAVRVA